ncbi:MAG: hypothetical protein LBU56_04765 [Rickettsiales bacterium]|jgi:uncharacterized circularly permuted ATP-grasp superfamily protein|nr:hypothetical protein [Rickettsiales bacterium]
MSNNNQKSSNNTLARLLSKTPEQVKTYCELLDNGKRRDLYEKVLQEMRKNPEINHVRRLNEIASAIQETIISYKNGDKREESRFIN